MLLVAGVYTVTVVWFAHAFSHFWGDDLSTFLLSETRPFWQFLFVDLGSQFVPLHRLVNLAVHRLCATSYGVALAVLLAFHLAAACYLYRTLRLLGTTRGNLLPVVVYLLHPFAGVNFLWFTSGLTRYPYIACSCAALFHYLSFVRSGCRGHLAAVFASYAIGLGFYSKAIFIPLYLAGLEAGAHALGVLLPRPGTSRARVLTLASLAAAGALYCFIARRALDPVMAQTNDDPVSVARVAVDSILVLSRTSVAWELNGATGPLGACIVVLAAAFAALAVHRVPRAAVSFSVLLLLTALNFCLIAVSSRVLLFGERSVVLDFRYYYEVWFLFVVFGGMPLPRLLAASSAIRRWMGRPAVLVAIPVLLAGYGFESLRGLGFVASERLWYGSMARLYLTNLETSLARVTARHGSAPSFVDGPLPRYLNTVDLSFTRHSHLFRALALPARFVNAEWAELLVAPDGRVVENPGRRSSQR